MARFTLAEAVNAARKAGFSASDSAIAGAIAMAESSGNSNATNGYTSNGKRYQVLGAWQISTIHPVELAMGDPFDLDTNARMAKSVYDKQGWKAWSVYTSGKYAGNLAAAKAVKVTDTPDGNVVRDLDGKPVTPASLNPLSGINGIGQAIENATAQAGKLGGNALSIIVAIVLLVLGIMLISRTQLMSAIPAGKLVKTAVKVLK